MRKVQEKPVVIVFLILIALLVPAQGYPQTQGEGTTKPKRRPAARAKPATVDPRAEAVKVAEQIKLLVRFIYLYGRIASGLELADEQTKRGETTPEQQAKVAQNKAALVENIKGIRAGLERLEQNFQVPPRKTWPTVELLKAVQSVEQAEQLAAAGRFDAAGRTLLSVVERLTDFLAELR